MLKLLLLGASSLASFGLLARVQDGAPAAVPPSDSPHGAYYAFASGKPDDPAANLRTAYVLLRQLKGERLEEQPRQLADRAIVLYRDGLKAFETGDVAAASKLGSASLELAQAVELTRVARADGDDPELPAPPSIRLRIEAKDGAGGRLEFKPFVVSLPPRLNGEVVSPPKADDDKHAEVKHVTGRLSLDAHNAKGEHELVVIDGGAGGQHQVLTIDGKELGKHEFVFEGPQDELRKRVLARVPVVQEDRVVRHIVRDDDNVHSHHELHAAYNQIREARAKYKGSEHKVYLDSARDLYHAARREAEAGRHARALELSRAAMALARVPALLSEDASDKKTEIREVRVERKAERQEKKEAKAERKEERKVRVRIEEAGKGDSEGQPKTIELRVTPDGEKKGVMRIETRKRTVGADGKSHDEVQVEEREIGPGEEPADVVARVHDPEGDDAGPLVGVGLMLEIDDDQIIVRGLVPEGPAAKEGSIKEGDKLVGIKVGDDTKEFKGQPLGDVVKSVRGEPGSKALLLIQSGDDDEPKVVEIVRDKLILKDVTEEKEEKDNVNDADDEDKVQTFHFTVPGADKGVRGEVKVQMAPLLRRLQPGTINVEGRPLRLEVKPKIELKEKGERRDSEPREKLDLPPTIEA